MIQPRTDRRRSGASERIATTGNPTTVVTTDNWTYAFDAEGRLTQESSPSGVVGYAYSALGRLTRTWAGHPGATASTALSDVTYTYDPLGRLATVNTVKRDGAVLDTNPGLTGNQPETSTFHYDLLGRPDYSELPNSVVEDSTFDNLDRLDVMRQYVSDADNANLTDNAIRALYDYTYRADGKRTELSETFELTPSGQRTTDYAWAYDAAGRLTSETLDSSDDTLDQTESYILDLVGNRLRRTIDKPSTANDRTDVVTLDTSDRLLTEQRYANLTGTGTPIQTTTYSWNGTQQASKAVAIPSTSTVTQTMSYGLTGQLERVITETKNGSNVVTARSQVEYRYDASGVRCVAVDSSDSNLATTGIERVENGRTEYLLDHNNATGYGQTLIETVKNSAGQATQRTSFTFGADEITQTVTTFNPSTGAVTATATHAFGHDGHGSVRVLFDAVATVNQVFTYSAYGEFLAIHNGAGVRTSGNAAALANPADALTKQLYNGENLDSRTGLYNFRARWYAAGSGRFERLDPYAGNFSDPQSLHKYLYVHGDPVQGVDSSGREFSLAGMMSSIGISSRLRAMNWGGIAAAAGRGLRHLALDFLTARSIMEIQQALQPVVQLPRQKVRADYQYALLAQAAYEDADPPDQGWRQIEQVIHHDTGFGARLFRRNGETVLAYAGTKTPPLEDWHANFQQGLFGSSEQYRQAIEVVPMLENQHGRIDRFVGHSLGGGLASAAAVVYNRPATTFNAAGLNPASVQQYGAHLDQAEQLIDAYRVQGEVLSTLQDMSPLWILFPDTVGLAFGVIGGLAPDSVGRAFWLDGESPSSIARHFMVDVLAGMRKMM